MSRPKRLPREELREVILVAARDILRDEGLEGLSARNIAKRVGYTAASIYNVFESMSDLVMELNRDTLAELQKIILGLDPEATPEDRLHELLGRYIAFMQKNPSMWVALFGGTRNRGSFPPWYVSTVRHLLGQVRNMLRELSPSLTEERADRLAEQLYIAIHGTVSLDLSRRLDLVTPQSAHEVGSAILDAVLVQFRR